VILEYGESSSDFSAVALVYDDFRVKAIGPDFGEIGDSIRGLNKFYRLGRRLGACDAKAGSKKQEQETGSQSYRSGAGSSQVHYKHRAAESQQDFAAAHLS
jgi:hypothetical protein